jgi:dienelactone hydrolase
LSVIAENPASIAYPLAMNRIVFTLPITLFWFQGSANAQDVIGIWSGMATAGAEDTRLILEISGAQDALTASMSLPDIGVSSWPAQTVEYSNDLLEIVFPSDSGPQRMRLEAHHGQMSGTWRENRFPKDAKVELVRAEVESMTREQPVEVRGPAGKLGATLIMPSCPDGCPGVVFLHGSGPQPRDSNRFAANELSSNGIASIIFDKRGVRESEGNLEGASFSDLASDAIAVAKELKRQPGITSVGFFGHSQGGWIASLAGSMWAETAFVITSAGPAVPPSREAEWDVVRQLRKNEFSPEIEEAARHIIQLWHDGVRTGDWGAFDVAIDHAMLGTWYSASGLEDFRTRPGQSFIKSYRAYMDYDPLPSITSQNFPMYALLTPDDESIDARETEKILRDLNQKGFDITVKIYPGYDHTMRRLGPDGGAIRWPEHPPDYFSSQVEFIQAISR